MSGTTATSAARRVSALLARTYFAERVEAARRQDFAAYEAWPQRRVGASGGPHSTEASEHTGDALWRLTHLGIVEREHLDSQLWGDLGELELAEGPDESGKWELTAYRGLIAARDRVRGSTGGEVYIGEDSLRFAETILGLAPRGNALDVGCGSGVSTCALGRTCDQIHAIDVVEECLNATRLSMEMSRMGSRVTTSHAGLDDYEAPLPFDCVVGNLPGVPVPPGLTYPPGGAGGPDGLALMRLFLDRCQTWCPGEEGLIIMRFQSLGDERGPLFLPELREIAERSRWDISVRTESRIPAEVRGALTAHHALTTNPETPIGDLLEIADRHLSDLGYAEYYASTLVARPGRGTLAYTNLSNPGLMDQSFRALRAGTETREALSQIVPLYYGQAHDLPDSFWELGSLPVVYEPIMRLESIVECLQKPSTVREVVGEVFADFVELDLLRARSLFVTVELLVACLLDNQLVVGE